MNMNKYWEKRIIISEASLAINLVDLNKYANKVFYYI